MIPYLILVLAALSRFVPHALHGIGLNITAVGGGLLFFGSRRPRPQALVAVAVMAFTDVILTRYVYSFPFHLRGYVVTWLWYGAVCLLGTSLLRRPTFLRVTSAVFASATGFLLAQQPGGVDWKRYVSAQCDGPGRLLRCGASVLRQ